MVVISNVAESTYRDTALYYCVDDLPEASVPGTRLQNILNGIRLDQPVTRLSQDFLRQRGLNALHDLATERLPYGHFRELALGEQSIRQDASFAARSALVVNEQARLAQLQASSTEAFVRLEAARLARERDPKYINQTKNRHLRSRYGVTTFVVPEHFGQLMTILKTIDAAARLSEQDFVWLSSVGAAYFSDELRAAHHRLEAEFFVSEFKKTRNPWAAVSASRHYRKCHRAAEAELLIATIDVDQQSSPKLQSALCTTHGGAMRDLRRWDEALLLGKKAHSLKPDDYRPCTATWSDTHGDRTIRGGPGVVRQGS